MFTFTLLAPSNDGNKGTNQFNFFPVDNQPLPVRSCLLTFDEDVKILADPSWDGKSDLSYLESIVNDVDLILLSHPTPDFIGGFVLLLYKYPALQQVPVYSTLPVANLGRVAVIDQYRSLGLVGPLKDAIFEVDDIEDVFDKINLLKNNQTTTLRGKFDNLTLTPYNAGHTLGGTFWLINKKLEKIIYAPSWNHSKDSFLNGAAFLQNNGNPLQQLVRPSCIITGTDLGSNLPHKKRTEKFLQLVDATLANGGSVLLPTSIGGRLLELLHLVDEHLQSAPIPVLMLAHTGTRVLSYAGSMLEWMAPQVIKEWESRNQVPFDASRVQLIEPHELIQLSGPKVVFCSGADFGLGSPAEACLLNLCSDQTTTIMLTERSLEGTVSNVLYKHWERLALQRNGSVEDGIAVPFENSINLNSVREESLAAQELNEYKNKITEKRKQKVLAKAIEKKNKNILTDDGNMLDESSDESSDEEEENDASLLNNTNNRETLDLNAPLDIDVRNARGRNRMFPYIQKRIKYDDYGEVIKPSDFTRAEEKEGKFDKRKNNNHNNNNTANQDTDVHIGEKRKWSDEKNKKDEKEEVNNLDSFTNPRKRFITALDARARCGLTFVDLAGLVDLRSISLLIPLLKPKKIILLSDLTDLRNLKIVSTQLTKINTKQNKYDLITAENNEPIQIGDVLQSYEVSLDETLSSSLVWQKIAGGYSVAHVIGEVVVQNKENGTQNGKSDTSETADDTITPPVSDVKLESEAKKQIDKADFVLTSLKESALNAIKSTPLAVGDIRLSELKKKLSSMGHTAEFKGEGTLVINNIIAIRKISDGDVIIDGTPSELFYEVRDCVRDMLAYV